MDYRKKYIKYKNKYILLKGMGLTNSNNKKNKILLTGEPGVGKSTLLSEIIDSLSCRKQQGFITKEIRSNGSRIGFKMETFGGKSGIIASTTSQTETKIGKWYIDVNKIDELIDNLQFSKTDLLILDEIAPMQLTSQKFIKLTQSWLDSPNNMIAIIKKDHDKVEGNAKKIIADVKNRSDVVLLELTSNNYNDMKDFIIQKLKC